MAERPRIVVLCGSTRFKDAFIEANFRETMAGRIVLSVGWFSHADSHVYAPTPEEKAALDTLHLRKVDLADEVLVINALFPRCSECKRWWKWEPGHYNGRNDFWRDCSCTGAAEHVPYVGESTWREIAYAESIGKPVRYLEARLG